MAHLSWGLSGVRAGALNVYWAANSFKSEARPNPTHHPPQTSIITCRLLHRINHILCHRIWMYKYQILYIFNRLSNNIEIKGIFLFRAWCAWTGMWFDGRRYRRCRRATPSSWWTRCSSWPSGSTASTSPMPRSDSSAPWSLFLQVQFITTT